MNEEESNERLRQLLRLKRHEAPPPGYYPRFQDGVLGRIRALEAERARSFWHRWFPRVSVGSVAEWGRRPAFLNVGAAAALLAALAAWSWIDSSTAVDSRAESSGSIASEAALPVGSSDVDLPPPPPVSLGPEVAEVGAWRTPEAAAPAAVPAVDPAWASGLAFPNPRVSWSARSRSPVPAAGFSSTNPLPEGLFRLPDGAGAESYRVRFTGSSR